VSRGPNPRLLIILLTFITGTVATAWAKPLGKPMMVLAGLFGAMAGWVAARWLMRKLF